MNGLGRSKKIAVCSAFLATAGVVTCFSQTKAVLKSVVATDAANDPTTHRLVMKSVGTVEPMHLTVGRSNILRGVNPMRRIYIGNPAILQSFTSGPDEVVVTAKAPGVSSLVIWDSQGQSCMYSVSADVDPAGLKASLAQAYPLSQIDVEATENRIALSGTVPTPEIADGAVKLAANYSKDIASSLRVVPIRGKQVQLKLRIVEVDRTKLEAFGFNLFRPSGNNTGSIGTQQFSSVISAAGTATDPLNLFFYSFSQNLGATIKDLEQKQILQVLAEPTLTTMSGLPARFLSGGEFPFPVAQAATAGSGAAISIQFRSYGVKVDFTPTVNLDASIRLKVAPEVSTLDYANAVTISGFTVPALATRRAETEVELKSGQSFVLTGLLDHRTTESLSKVPGIANVPILGQLFRSKNNNHSITELVVIVTATTVDPVNDPSSVSEPKMVVPNMQSTVFDQQVNQPSKSPVKK